MSARVGAVIPAYRVGTHILDVLAAIGPEIDAIYVVDDGCPEQSGELVRSKVSDRRVQVIVRDQNGGVGAAVKTGWRQALEDGCDVIIKIDGDGQMDPALAPVFISPILERRADYTKGNRFFDPESLRSMPRLRVFGNAGLSFLAKLSSGYWQMFDPTNGYVAISATALRMLPLDKIADGYFFESDVLFRLGTVRAVVKDIPMDARYAGEYSSLRVSRVFLSFLWGHISATLKRITYNHYLRGFSVASLELLLAIPLLLFGLFYGANAWIESVSGSIAATSGTVMLAALPIILGMQLLLAFIQYDVESTPTDPLVSLSEPGPPDR